MWKSDKELYNECIAARALDYLANHEDKPVIEYLEFNAGPVLQTWMFKMGIRKVTEDLELKIIEEKSLDRKFYARLQKIQEDGNSN